MIGDVEAVGERAVSCSMVVGLWRLGCERNYTRVRWNSCAFSDMDRMATGLRDVEHGRWKMAMRKYYGGE